MAGTECPICSRTFASESIEEHAATCVGEEDDGSRVSPADEEVPTSAGPIGAPGPAAGAGADVGDVYVGTAGYNYTHWRKGAFYPRGLSQSNELKHYSGVFSAVEINASFHGGVYVAPLCPFTRVHFSQLASNNKQHTVDFIQWFSLSVKLSIQCSIPLLEKPQRALHIDFDHWLASRKST